MSGVLRFGTQIVQETLLAYLTLLVKWMECEDTLKKSRQNKVIIQRVEKWDNKKNHLLHYHSLFWSTGCFFQVFI